MRTLSDALKWAEEKKIALGHFNIAGFEQFQAIVNVARKLDLPVLIGVSEGEREYLGVRRVRDLADSVNREFGNPDAEWGFWLFVNADHTHSIEKAKEAAAAGFDEVLFDGGKLSLEENIKKTQEAIRLARAAHPDVVIEGELGYIGTSSEIRTAIPEGAAIKPEDLTKPEEALRFVEVTGVDMLAPAVGNIHGMFANMPDPGLDLQRIRTIKDAVKIPLVLHGGSGNTDADFLAAINAGINIIHISTELRLAWRKSLERALKENPSEIAPYKLMPGVIAAAEEVVERRLRLFSKIS